MAGTKRLNLAVRNGFYSNHQWLPLVIIGVAALLQTLFFIYWDQAKWYSLINLLLLLMAVSIWAAQRFEQIFIADVHRNLSINKATDSGMITEADIAPLPMPVQQYIRYSGALNRPQLYNMRITFEGKMRAKGKDWFPFTTLQYNFFQQPTRLFFMKARMWGIKVPGYHHYENARATMDVKLFGLFSVVKAQGRLMDKAETVTLFNDMCLLAPGSLIDKRIQWQPIDDRSAQAVFTNGNITISAILYFNGQGQLVNFVCDERYDVNSQREYRFSTPVMAYTSIGGYRVLQTGNAVWHYPDGAFEYGQFILKDIAYNVTA